MNFFFHFIFFLEIVKSFLLHSILSPGYFFNSNLSEIARYFVKKSKLAAKSERCGAVGARSGLFFDRLPPSRGLLPNY